MKAGHRMIKYDAGMNQRTVFFENKKKHTLYIIDKLCNYPVKQALPSTKSNVYTWKYITLHLCF